MNSWFVVLFIIFIMFIILFLNKTHEAFEDNNSTIMTVENLYQFSKDQLTCDDSILYISEFDFFLCCLTIIPKINKVALYADEYLYIINKLYYPNSPYYTFFVNQYNNTIKEQNSNIINHDKHVISFISTFSRGTVHAYIGFYQILFEFLDNIEKYQNLDIILYEETDKGIITIINYLVDKEYLKNNIIYLKKNTKYKFKSITYVKYKHHIFRDELRERVTNFILKYNINDSQDINSIQNNIYCIIKTINNNSNIHSNGSLEEKIVTNFCNKYNIERIYPNENEIDLINKIYNCKILIVSFGSTFYKNYVYISELCEKVIVVVNGDVYMNEYKDLMDKKISTHDGIDYSKYKNATFHYILGNDTLNFNPLTI